MDDDARLGVTLAPPLYSSVMQRVPPKESLENSRRFITIISTSSTSWAIIYYDMDNNYCFKMMCYVTQRLVPVVPFSMIEKGGGIRPVHITPIVASCIIIIRYDAFHASSKQKQRE